MMLVAIAATMMVLLDFVNERMNDSAPAENTALVEIEQGMDAFNLDNSEIKDFKSAQDVLAKMKPAESVTDDVFLHGPPPEAIEIPAVSESSAPLPVKEKHTVQKPSQSWKEHAVKLKAPPGGAKIVIIIDDMGVDRARSNEVVDMDGPLTLAFLPYASNLGEITGRASANGHELLIHAPMEPLNSDLDPGPVALLDDMSMAELDKTLAKMFSSFEGYVGINNHMGSKVTQNEPILHRVMGALADRGLIFVDSKTIHTSMAGQIAAEHGLDYAERDVFLDHENTPEFVAGALAGTEEVALRRGMAIAMGHPKDVTIQALKEWLPDVRKRGFTIVPVSSVVKHKNPEDNGPIAAKLPFGPAQPPALPPE